MADYNVGTLEVQVMASANAANVGLTQLVLKINDMQRSLEKTIPAFDSINRLANGLTKINKLNVSNITNQFDKLTPALDNAIAKLNAINTSTFDTTATSLNRLANGINKISNIGNIDFRKTYQSVNSLTRILTPFLAKLKESEAALIALVNAGNMFKNIQSSLKNANVQTKNLSTNFKNTGIQAEKTSKTMSNVFSMGKLYLIYNYSRRIGNMMSRIVGYGIDFIETANLFQVSMGDMYYTALKFNNQLSEAFGLSNAQLMRFQATFKNMLSALNGLSDEVSYNLSEALTKSAIDYAALFNTSIESAMTAYQSVLAGQVRPIRSTSGFDVTEITIFAKAQELGVNKTMRQLSQLEKRLLRIIVLNDQMYNVDAMANYALTIEQPAQQLKILSAQLELCGQWISTVFMGTISNVLPYVNAFVMTLKEMIKSLAFLNGWKMEIIRTETDPLTNIADNANNAGDALDKLQNKLFSFDKFEVLGGGSTTAVNSAYDVDPKITAALKEYENLMNSISMKANEIKTSMLEWLGYIPTEELDAAGVATGGIVWQLKEGSTNLGKINTAFRLIGDYLIALALPKLLTLIGNGFIALTASTKNLGKVLTNIGLMAFVYAVTELVKNWDNLNTSQKVVYTGLLALAGAFLLVKSGMWDSIVIMWLYAKDAIVAVVSAIQKMITWLGGLSAATWTTVGAFAGLAAAFLFLMYMDELDAKTRTLVGSLMLLVGALTVAAVAWMAYHGAMTMGVAVPIILGATAVGIAGIAGMMSGIKEMNGYANGGFPEQGELFIAREKGTEMVGTMNNKPAVANNDQIIDGIKRGVYEAVIAAFAGNRNSTNITVDFKNTEDSIIARAMVKPLKSAFIQQGIKVGG